MRFISKNIICLNLSKVKLKSFDIIVQLWDLIEECHFMEELVFNDCGIIYGSNIKKIILSFKELYRLKNVSMVQNFTKDQCVMIVDQIDDIIIDSLKENISIIKFAIIDDSKIKFDCKLDEINRELELNIDITQHYSIEHIFEGEEISIEHLKICKRK